MDCTLLLYLSLFVLCPLHFSCRRPPQNPCLTGKLTCPCWLFQNGYWAWSCFANSRCGAPPDNSEDENNSSRETTATSTSFTCLTYRTIWLSYFFPRMSKETVKLKIIHCGACTSCLKYLNLLEFQNKK